MYETRVEAVLDARDNKSADTRATSGRQADIAHFRRRSQSHLLCDHVIYMCIEQNKCTDN